MNLNNELSKSTENKSSFGSLFNWLTPSMKWLKSTESIKFAIFVKLSMESQYIMKHLVYLSTSKLSLDVINVIAEYCVALPCAIPSYRIDHIIKHSIAQMIESKLLVKNHDGFFSIDDTAINVIQSSGIYNKNGALDQYYKYSNQQIFKNLVHVLSNISVSSNALNESRLINNMVSNFTKEDVNKLLNITHSQQDKGFLHDFYKLTFASINSLDNRILTDPNTLEVDIMEQVPEDEMS